MTSQTTPSPELTFERKAYNPTTVQCFLFSASTWNSHRIHYDESYAIGIEGHRGVLVPGPLQGAFVEQFLSAQLPDGTRVTKLQYRNTAPVVAGTELFGEAEVEGAEDGEVTVNVRLVKEDGTVTTKGRAWIATGSADTAA